MYEVEAKAKAKKTAEEAVRRMATYSGEERQEDTYFRHPARDFARTDEALRIRNAGGKLTLTYKGPKLDRNTKTRAELETTAQPELFGILERLGFRIAHKVSKVRTNYRKGRTTISIDKVKGLGTFIEAETQAKSRKELGKAKKELMRIFASLGYTQKDSIRKSYLEMLLENRNK